MSAYDRLYWLTAEIHRGRSAFVTFSFNGKSNKEKVKFVLDDSCASHGVFRPAVMAALSAVQASLEFSVVTDKGHRSKTSGLTTIEFWIQQAPTSPAESEPAPQSEQTKRLQSPFQEPLNALKDEIEAVRQSLHPDSATSSSFSPSVPAPLALLKSSAQELHRIIEGVASIDQAIPSNIGRDMLARMSRIQQSIEDSLAVGLSIPSEDLLDDYESLRVDVHCRLKTIMASSTSDSTDIQQHQSTIPRDIERTDRFSSPRKKKSRRK